MRRLALLALLLLMAWGMLTPHAPAPPGADDHLLHTIVSAAWAAACLWAYPRDRRLALALGAAAVTVLEWAQGFVEGRTRDGWDLAYGLLGVVAAHVVWPGPGTREAGGGTGGEEE